MRFSASVGRREGEGWRWGWVLDACFTLRLWATRDRPRKLIPQTRCLIVARCRNVCSSSTRQVNVCSTRRHFFSINRLNWRRRAARGGKTWRVQLSLSEVTRGGYARSLRRRKRITLPQFADGYFYVAPARRRVKHALMGWFSSQLFAMRRRPAGETRPLVKRRCVREVEKSRDRGFASVSEKREKITDASGRVLCGGERVPRQAGEASGVFSPRRA